MDAGLREQFRKIGNASTDPAVLAGVGIGIASLHTAGTGGIIWNSLSVVTFFAMRYVAEGRANDQIAQPQRTVASSLTLVPSTTTKSSHTLSWRQVRDAASWQNLKTAPYKMGAQTAEIVTHPGTSWRKAKYTAKQAIYDFASQPRSTLRAQGISQGGLVLLDYITSKLSPIMVATAMIAYGNYLEAAEKEERKKAIAKGTHKVFATFHRPLAAHVINPNLVQRIEHGTNRVLFNVAFNPHVHWTGGLATIAYVAGQPVSAAICAAGLGVNLLRSARPHWTGAIGHSLQRATRNIRSRFNLAAQSSIFRRAGASIATLPTRGARWMIDSEQAALAWLTLAFGYGCEAMIHEGLVYGTADWKLKAVKLACYAATGLSVVAMERCGGVMEALIPSMRKPKQAEPYPLLQAA